ncbi:hypothetical protein QCA50_002378 [Cerrena zonata]|uniref:Uncharacterized protein n=1 Tax=Cerrena zonata TaxID=2478898 RepID=A0AAW0GNL9_9APHY
MVVTPELVQHMDSAAASNPTLLKLVQEVAAGHATQNQKETLELLLQTFKSTPGEVSQPQPSTGVINFSAPQTASRTPDFDIVLDFNDKPGDRWIFPRGPVNIQPIRGHQGEDLIVNAVLPFPSTLDEASGKYKEIVAFRFAGVMFTVHDLMNRWVGGHEKAVEYTRVLNEIAAKWPKRQFLQHQLPPGLLLDQLKAAVTPNFAMKSIKPSNDNARNKRRAPRRSTAQATATNATPQQSAQPRASPSEGRTTSDETPAKRRKSNAANLQASTTTIQIACHSCGQTDVPLMMGGRYCRPCIDSGKAKADIPSATVSRNTAERSGTKPLRRGSTLSAPALVAHSPLATNPPVVFAPVQTPQNIGQSQEHR